MTYRVYVTECLAKIVDWEGKNNMPKYYEFINRNQAPTETRSGDEIKESIVTKLNNLAGE